MLYRRAVLYVLLIMPMLLGLAGCGSDNSSPPTAVTGATVTSAQQTPDTSDAAPTSVVGTSDTAQPQEAGADSELYDIGEAVTSKPEFSASLAVMGVIKYKGATPRVNPVVSVSLLDPNGQVLVKGTAVFIPAYVRPGSNIPYKSLFSNPPESWDRIEVTINAMEATDSTLTYGDLEVTQPSLIPPQTESDSVQLSGTVKNTGGKAADLVTVVGVLYDADGKVVDVNNGYPKTATLAAGEESQFEIDFFGIKAADKFELFASGVAKQ